MRSRRSKRHRYQSASTAGVLGNPTANERALEVSSQRRPVDPTSGDLAPERLYDIARAAIRRAIGTGFGSREDLVQEALERVFRGLNSGRFAGQSALSTWVTAIAQHVALEELRLVARNRTPRGHPFPDVVEAATPIDLEHQLEARSALARVQRLLATMDSATAEVMLLHDLLGHDLSEVAVLTNLSVAAAQSRLARARKTVQRKLKHQLRR